MTSDLVCLFKRWCGVLFCLVVCLCLWLAPWVSCLGLSLCVCWVFLFLCCFFSCSGVVTIASMEPKQNAVSLRNEGGAHVSKPKCEPRLQSSLVVALRPCLEPWQQQNSSGCHKQNAWDIWYRNDGWNHEGPKPKRKRMNTRTPLLTWLKSRTFDSDEVCLI